MKIIVDEMPKQPNDCLLYSLCNLYQELRCEPCKCPYLKPITDFHAEKVIEKHDDGSCTLPWIACKMSEI